MVDGVNGVGPPDRPAPAASSPAFRSALDEALRWSKHADRRGTERGVTVGPEQARQVAAAVSEARQRGVRSLVVVLPDTVMLVAPSTNTVVTTMGLRDADRRLFTNVDGVVLLGRS